MTIRYRVDLEDTTGSTVASFSQFKNLSFTQVISGKGSYRFSISGFDSRKLLFDDDFLIRIYTDDRASGITWREVFTGIHKTFTDGIAENGQMTYSSFGPSLEEILDKAVILYPAGSSNTDKSGVASTVMYEFVTENVTASATTANGREADGTNPITNSPDLAVGPTWDGSAAWKNLMITLQKIRNYSIDQGDQIDFRVVYLGSYTFQFQAGDIGTDRTTAGLTATSNGLNGAGNVPVIFSVSQGNVMTFTKSQSRFNEANLVVALGQDPGSSRKRATASDALLIAASPIAQREMVTNAVNIDSADTAGLQAVADAKLAQKRSRLKFSFQPKRGAQILFRDYFVGDFVTGEDDEGNRQDKQIREATVTVSPTANALIERVSMKFSDI